MSVSMPFGKYRYMLLEDIPADYLEWVLDNCHNISPYLRAAIEEDLENRDDSGKPRQTKAEPRPAEKPWLRTSGGSNGNSAATTEDIRQQAIDEYREEMARVVAAWYRQLCREHHPDRGGDANTFQVLNNAHKRLKEELGFE